MELGGDPGPPRHFFLSFLRFSIVTNYCTCRLYLLVMTKATANIVKRCDDVPQKLRFSPNGGFAIRPSSPILMRWPWVATDVCSGWAEAVPLVAREQFLVIEGLAVMRRQFPVPIRGIDTDNDSAFINETLQGYCQEQQLEFTRSRAYQKNDQTWIEQKNGSVIRRFVGYHRFSGLVAGQCLARLYRAVRLDVNYSDHH